MEEARQRHGEARLDRQLTRLAAECVSRLGGVLDLEFSEVRSRPFLLFLLRGLDTVCLIWPFLIRQAGLAGGILPLLLVEDELAAVEIIVLLMANSPVKSSLNLIK